AFLVRVPLAKIVTPPADTTPPTVSITAPSQSATLAGNVLLTAAASDTNGVAGLQFMIDGVAFGGEFAGAPYALNWDTTSVSDGVHVLTTVAWDASGNFKTSVPVSVTVLNAPAGPQISGVNASQIKQTRAVVGWTTSQLADGQIEYGPTTTY